ncbi:MAG: efflux RND transporter permease subunit [Victivallaceae bacterium]|nr:efflux RND transporter permease subunit [Victivallaceae bacterium]
MTLCEISLKRKVAMCAFILMLLFLGLAMYRTIGIDTLPKFDVPYIQISTVYPGASPEEIEVDVAKRIEDAVASIDGLKHTTSVCMENLCATTLEFEIGTDVDLMVHEVREKLNTIADDFPALVEKPKLGKLNINAIAVVTLVLTGPCSTDELYDYADQTLSDRFSSIPGVGEVRIHGGNEMQLHVILDRKKLQESNLTIAEIVSRINSANMKLPAGRIRQNGTEMNITYDAEYRDIESLKNLEISSTVGKRIYLGDLAEIKLMSKEIRQLASFNGQPGIQLEIVKKSNANAVKVIDEVKKRYGEITSGQRLPGGMKLNWFKDSGAFIHASVNDAWSSIALGVLLTAVVLVLFLHDIRAAFIAAITMPTSIVISFIAMKLLGYTFDMMTLVSLGCATGTLVTNAVIVLENIFKHMQSGRSPQAASISGTQEVMNAVAASALTNVVVFVPVALMGSVVGLLIGPFAGVNVIVTLASLFMSFTLTPILSSVLLSGKARQPGALLRFVFRSWDFVYFAMEHFFIRGVIFTKSHSGMVIVGITGISILLMAISIPHLAMSFLPTNDKGEISITLEFPPNSALDSSAKTTAAIVQELKKRNDVAGVAATTGYLNAMVGQVSEGVHLSEISLYLVEKEKRGSVFEVARALRKQLANYDNLRYSVNIPNPMGSSGAEVIAYITGSDSDVLRAEGQRAMKILKESDIAMDIDSSLRGTKPRMNLIPQRAVLRNLGVSETMLGNSVLGFFDGIEAGTYKVGSRTYDIRVKASEEERFDSARNIVIGSLNGRPVNIDVLTTMESSPVSISMIRQDKERSVWIYCNPAKGAVLGEVVNLLRAKIGTTLPPGYKLSFYGPAEVMESGAADFANVFVIAIVMTYLLIAGLMESWTRPFLILFTIPLGFAGMFFALYLSGEAMSMIAMLSGVMMIGIVVNDAILMMDETSVLIAGGMKPHDAMLQAVKNKHKAMLMTSFTSVVGMLPLAFGSGMGAELRANCGIGVVGGLIYAAVATLFLIPALYFKFAPNSAAPGASLSCPRWGFFRKNIKRE